MRKPATVLLMAAVAIGTALTSVAIVWHDSQPALLFATPGMALSTLLGTNDKWGLPAVIPYMVGGIVTWTLITYIVLIIIATVRRSLSRHTSPS